MADPAKITFKSMNGFHRPDKRGRLEQAAAICLRPAPNGDDLEILLIASSSTGLWGLPKGHIEPGETSLQTALREAGEEAGIEGCVADTACGFFTYRKLNSVAEYRVTVHLLMVSRLRDHYAESSSREKKWVSLVQASGKVANPSLARILERVAQSRMGPAGVA